MKINRRFFKKLQNKNFVDSLIRIEAERDKENSWFFDFKCSSFFKGSKLAELNYEIYKEEQRSIDKRWKHLQNIRSRITE